MCKHRQYFHKLSNEGNVLLGCMLVIPACSFHSRSDDLMVAVLVGYCHAVLCFF